MNGFYFDDNTEAWKSRTWYHIAYTYDGSTVQLYIDGQNTGLAQIRMWDSCLPQATIQDARNREVAADSPGLLGYWKCSEGEGNILHDSTSNGNHITLRGTPDWNAYGVINFMNPNN